MTTPNPSTPVVQSASNGEGEWLLTTNLPEFNGTADPFSKVEIFIDGASYGLTRADSSGNWILKAPASKALDDGEYEISAQTISSRLIESNIQAIGADRTYGEYQNESAFAAIRKDGSVVTWGNPRNGGDSSDIADLISSDVEQIFSSRKAFVALKSDGSAIAWGDMFSGGDSGNANLANVQTIYSNKAAFAALKKGGSVVTWGRDSSGGDSSRVANELKSGITKIVSSDSAFAAIKVVGESRTVVTWGSAERGGDMRPVAESLSSGIVDIYSTESAFAALKEDGTVITWGAAQSGGSSAFLNLKDIKDISANQSAFAALSQDGLLSIWGSAGYGGIMTEQEKEALQLHPKFQKVYSTNHAFAALSTDGSVFTWGDPAYGGDSSNVSKELQEGVIDIYSTDGAFAAVKENGAVITWGHEDYGGNNSKAVGELESGVKTITANWRSFAALKEDGSVVTWGDAERGGNSMSVKSDLSSGIDQIFSTDRAFSALKLDGTVISWGDSNYGGYSSNSDLTDIATIASPFYYNRIDYQQSAETRSEESEAIAFTIKAPPVITSSEVATAIQENSGSNQIIYTITAVDDQPITYQVDSPEFKVDKLSGDIYLIENPDYETKQKYVFTVSVTDENGNLASKEISLDVIDDNHSPQFIGDYNSLTIMENAGNNQVITQVLASDDSQITFSIQEDSSDKDLFHINEKSGILSLLSNPDYELKTSYDVIITATDAEGHQDSLPINLIVKNDNKAPEFILNDYSISIYEDTKFNQVISTIKAIDESPIIYSLKESEDFEDFL